TVCEKYGLNDFERQVLLVLFVHSTSMEFREMLESCSIEHWKFDDDGITAGTILSILCPEYRGQIINRKHFSIENPLVKHEIVIPQGFYNNRNIMDVDIEIHERITNFILGDNNKYDTDLSCISTERTKVNLDQVIMDPTLKNDIVRLAENYSSLAGKRQDLAIDSFYGYGTGLTFLFFGPSGTGKTMLAHGLATHLGKNLLSLNMAGLSSQNLSFDDAVKYMFREARLSNGIVFLDECDDLLKDNSHDSRAFLIEIEKAECITIMASNKVTTLDPALDRRISMKVPFSLPDESERSGIWQALIPPGVTVSDTVDFQILSKKYVFSGGLIKNTIFMAINNVMPKNSKGEIRLSSEALIQAADYQAKSMFDQNGLGETYLPHTGFDELGVKKHDRHKMKQLGTLYERLRQENLGMSCVLTVADLQTGVKC
ncbi:MAG: AAA family ATPase, partial [Desulfobulbaceae bacterium]|nr:AAA family ATPase [Desulfobulbaceae bacterium]